MHGDAKHCLPRQGWQGRAWRGKASPCKAVSGGAWRSVAGLGWLCLAERRRAWRSVIWQSPALLPRALRVIAMQCWLGKVGQVLARHGRSRLARQGLTKLGWAQPGLAGLCTSLLGWRSMDLHGVSGRCTARQGARQGVARLAVLS